MDASNPPDSNDRNDEPEEGRPPLGQEEWDRIAELTDAYDNDRPAYDAWSDAVDEYNDSHDDEI